MAEERMRDDTCPTCGGPVVVQGDGLTHWYRPAPTDQGERDGLAERLEREIIGYSISLGLTEAQFDLLREAASRLRTSTEGPTRVDLAWAFSLLLDCLQKGKEPEDYEWDRINAIDDALTRDESSTEGGTRVSRHDLDRLDELIEELSAEGQSPHLSALRSIRPAQSEGAGEARVRVDD